jgi:hypothetical protein
MFGHAISVSLEAVAHQKSPREYSKTLDSQAGDVTRVAECLTGQV